MKVILVSVLIFFSLTSYSQTKEEIIKNIRQQFRSTNADKNLKKITLEDEEFLENIPDGGGELNGFYRKDSILKIIECIGLSYGNRTREYYFHNGNLFFAFEKFESFAKIKNGGLDHSKTKTTFEGRYYFNKEIMIGQKLLGKRTFEQDSKNIDKQLVKNASSYFIILTKKMQNK